LPLPGATWVVRPASALLHVAAAATPGWALTPAAASATLPRASWRRSGPCAGSLSTPSSALFRRGTARRRTGKGQGARVSARPTGLSSQTRMPLSPRALAR
jgi:hypothetical protein